MEELLTVKELAQLLKRHESYVWAMRRQGFRFIAGRTTMTAALRWLASNPNPWSSKRTATK